MPRQTSEVSAPPATRMAAMLRKLRSHSRVASPSSTGRTSAPPTIIERLNGEFRRRVKTQGSLPSEGAAPVLLFGLIATGPIPLRKNERYKKLAGVISGEMRGGALS